MSYSDSDLASDLADTFAPTPWDTIESALSIARALRQRRYREQAGEAKRIKRVVIAKQDICCDCKVRSVMAAAQQRFGAVPPPTHTGMRCAQCEKRNAARWRAWAAKERANGLKPLAGQMSLPLAMTA